MSVMDVAAVVPWVTAILGVLWTARLAMRAASDVTARSAVARSARSDLVLAAVAMVSLAAHRTDLGMLLAGCYVLIVAIDVAVIRPIVRGRCADDERTETA